MRKIERGRPIHYLSPFESPVATIQPGEEVLVEVYDTYTGQIATASDLRTDIDLSKLTPLTGPIEIAGAEPGDSLVVTIKHIALAEQGVMVIAPGLGVLGLRVDQVDTKIIPIRDGGAVFGEKLILPVHPMIGTIGVAPRGEPMRSYTPGDYGGNMDIKDVGMGSRVYLPVFVEGAMLALGDLHALQGDGELDGTGIEIAGEVTLTAEVRHQVTIPQPRIETEDWWMVVASARSLQTAIELAVSDMVASLSVELGLPFIDAYRLVSALGDLRVGQLVNPRVTVRVAVPKWLLEGL
jgi:amidase